MHILESSPRRLILEDRPWVLGIVLMLAILLPLFLALVTWRESLWLAFAMVLMAARFGMAFVIFVRRVIVIFDRDADAVLIRTVSLFGRSDATHALSRVSRASVETSINRSTSSGGRTSTTSRTHRTVLHIAEKIVPLTQVYSGGDGADRMAAAINDWLRR